MWWRFTKPLTYTVMFTYHRVYNTWLHMVIVKGNYTHLGNTLAHYCHSLWVHHFPRLGHKWTLPCAAVSGVCLSRQCLYGNVKSSRGILLGGSWVWHLPMMLRLLIPSLKRLSLALLGDLTEKPMCFLKAECQSFETATVHRDLRSLWLAMHGRKKYFVFLQGHQHRQATWFTEVLWGLCPSPPLAYCLLFTWT